MSRVLSRRELNRATLERQLLLHRHRMDQERYILKRLDEDFFDNT